ncbi:MAG: hypothetical protein IGQ45_12070 [Cyanobacterium sp. T60_A2020_053]|nr:hypothetical protein [Cyanobacterium sp. T60_A2020_053]
MITGIILLSTISVASYLLKISRENELRAVQQKLITEEKLTRTLQNLREVIREKEATESELSQVRHKIEQIIRERKGAEESQQQVNAKIEQLMGEKQEIKRQLNLIKRENYKITAEKKKAEELARITQIKFEQIKIEKQQAKELVKMAILKCEQAIKEKEKAEELALTIQEKVEQIEMEKQRAEEDVIYLYESIEEDTKKLEQKVTDLEAENKFLAEENQNQKSELVELQNKCNQLSSHLMAVNNSDNDSSDQRERIYFYIREKNFYPDEIKEIILDLLKQSLHNVYEGSRRDHILRDLLHNNPSNGSLESLKKEIHDLFNNYRSLNPKMRRDLGHLGFQFVDNKHHKIRFYQDDRYTHTFASSASDHRAGTNNASEICRLIL